MHPYRIAIAVVLLLFLPHWSSADPAEEQAIKQADKPTPVVQSFHGCPARGHGGDEDLNFLKNRVDVPDSLPGRRLPHAPRVREQHAHWTTAALRQFVGTNTKVRISGWLTLDQEHPEQIGKTRGTLWEIHPITRIEIFKDNRWTALDDLP